MHLYANYNCLLFGAGEIRNLQRQHCGCFINFIMPAPKVAKLTTTGWLKRWRNGHKAASLLALKTGLNCRPRPFYDSHTQTLLKTVSMSDASLAMCVSVCVGVRCAPYLSRFCLASFNQPLPSFPPTSSKKSVLLCSAFSLFSLLWQLPGRFCVPA